MPFIIDSNGIQIQTEQELRAQIAAAIQAQFGNNINVTAESQIGQLINIFVEPYTTAQQQVLSLYQSFDPNSANGVLLDQRSALTGTIRRGETFSIVEGEVTTSGPVNIPNGSLIRLDSNETVWELISGPIVEPGGGTFPATFQCTTAGPITATSGSDWTIISVIANWDLFENPVEDATPGQLQESDGSFRQRRNVELFSEGRGSLNSIAAVVSEVNTENGFVERVRVYHNPDVNPVNSIGIPFKAFNVVVRTNPPIDPLNLPPTADLQQDIADVILRVLGAGGEAFGTDVQLQSVDIEDQNQDVAFDVFRDADIYLNISVQTANFIAPFNNQPVIPLDPQVMADLIIEYVVERANEELTAIGEDVLAYQIEAFVNELVDSEQLRGINTVFAGSNKTSLLDPFVEVTDVGEREIPNYNTGRVIVGIDGANYVY